MRPGHIVDPRPRSGHSYRRSEANARAAAAGGAPRSSRREVAGAPPARPRARCFSSRWGEGALRTAWSCRSGRDRPHRADRDGSCWSWNSESACRFAEDLRGKRPITAEARWILTTDKRNSIRQFFAGDIVTGFGFELVDYPSNQMKWVSWGLV